MSDNQEIVDGDVGIESTPDDAPIGEIENDSGDPPNEGEQESQESEKVESDGDEQSEGDKGEEEGQEGEGEGEPDEDDGYYLSFEGDESEPEPKRDSGTLNAVRKTLRKREKEIRELRQKLESRENVPEDHVEDIGPEPTLESCEYDETLFREKLLEHDKRKQAAESKQQAKREKQQAAANAWNEKLNAFEDQRGKVRNEDFELVEDFVNQTLSPAQRSMIIHSSKRPVDLLYSLGKSPEDLKRIAQIEDDPIAFAYEVGLFQAKREPKVVKQSKKPPAPERRVRGSAPRAASGDAELNKLRAEAERTGNYTKVHEYKRGLSSD